MIVTAYFIFIAFLVYMFVRIDAKLGKLIEFFDKQSEFLTAYENLPKSKENKILNSKKKDNEDA